MILTAIKISAIISANGRIFFGGRCEWNSNLIRRPILNQRLDPRDPEECVISLGELRFYDKAKVYRYGV